MLSLKIKDKLLLLILIPLSGLLLLSIIVSYDRYIIVEKSNSLNKVVHVSSKISELIVELQKERGIANGYVSSQGILFKKKFITQTQTTNKKIKHLQEHINKINFSVYQNSLKKSIIDSIQTLNIKKILRDRILSQYINNEEIIEFYSKIIADFLEIIRQSADFSPNIEVLRQLNAQSSLLFAIERIAVERAVGTVVFSSKISLPKMQMKFNEMISQQKDYIYNFSKFANKITLEYFKKTVQGKEFDEIKRMRNVLRIDVKKKAIMSKISKLVGYGGIIHNFKNYLIRSENKYRVMIKKQNALLNSLINEYKSFGKVSKYEHQALNIISNTFQMYLININVIKAEIDANNNHYNTISLIDEIVSIDDKPAINALVELSTSNFFVDSAEYWFNINTSKITRFNQLNEFITSTIIKEAHQLAQLSKNYMYIFISSVMFILIVIYFLGQRVISHINNETEALSLGIESFFKYINKEESNIKPIKIYSNDEIGSMSKIINHKIIRAKIIIDDNIIEKAEQLELLTSKLDEEVQVKTKELKILNEGLEQKVNIAIEEIRKKDELLSQQAKLAAMGEMIGNIAHQWRQPLNVIAGNIQFLKDDYEDGMIDEEFLNTFIHENMETIRFMSKTIDDFRDFFRTDKVKGNFKILACIDKPINIVKPQLSEHHIELEISGDDFIINGLEGEFQQVILNVVNNARDVLLENRVQNAKIKVETKIEGEKGIVTIQDNAGGIPKDVINRIFEPYYTTKEQGKGTGIGLYMSKMIIVDNMKGKFSAFNLNDGACFEIKLNTVKEKL